MGIIEGRYAAYQWIEFMNLSDEELQQLYESWKVMPQLETFSLEDKMVCLVFKRYKPTEDNDFVINKAKRLNEKERKVKMQILNKGLKKFGYYFNPSKQFITKLR
jgi:hypothetical protein